MKQAVVIKGSMSNNIYGLTVVLNPEIPFDDLKEKVASKFRESSQFLKNPQMAVSLTGRELEDGQEQELLDIIIENSNIEVLYLVDENQDREALYKERVLLEQRINEIKNMTPVVIKEESSEDSMKEVFYRGTLRSGQVLESEGSVVVLGDVNPGASIMAGGNVVVLGLLKGIANAGIFGNRESFVVALEMRPTQIRIADQVATCSDDVTSTPMIAFMRGEDICFEPISKNLMKKINF
jgi:septum site-determining protein MinC